MSRSHGLKAVVGISLVLVLVFTATFLIADAFGLIDEGATRDAFLRLSTEPGGRWLAAAGIGGLLAADLFLPVPSSVLMTVSGLVLGVAAGTAVSFVASVLSAAIGFGLCRRFGRAAFVRLVGDDFERVGRFLDGQGAWAILLSRSVPMLTEVVSCLAGLSAMRWSRFLILTAAGTLPVCAVYAWAGATARESSLWWPLLVAFILPAAGFGVVSWRRAQREPSDST